MGTVVRFRRTGASERESTLEIRTSRRSACRRELVSAGLVRSQRTNASESLIHFEITHRSEHSIVVLNMTLVEQKWTGALQEIRRFGS
jgi:hypothetical protein